MICSDLKIVWALELYRVAAVHENTAEASCLKPQRQNEQRGLEKYMAKVFWELKRALHLCACGVQSAHLQ